jgi:hypothetical protein
MARSSWPGSSTLMVRWADGSQPISYGTGIGGLGSADGRGAVWGWAFWCCCHAHFQVTFSSGSGRARAAGHKFPHYYCHSSLWGLARRVPVYFLDWIDLWDGISPFVCRTAILSRLFFPFDRKYVLRRIFTAFWGLTCPGPLKSLWKNHGHGLHSLAAGWVSGCDHILHLQRNMALERRTSLTPCPWDGWIKSVWPVAIRFGRPGPAWRTISA